MTLGMKNNVTSDISLISRDTSATAVIATSFRFLNCFQKFQNVIVTDQCIIKSCIHDCCYLTLNVTILSKTKIVKICLV